MQQDKRNLTVALEHLRAAYDEITLAQGNPERSIAEAAARRALDHLNLIVRRLEHGRSTLGRDAEGQAVERSYAAAQLAWQAVHDALNDWPRNAALVLDPLRNHLIEAIETLGTVCEPPPREEALRR
jgi:hypothetical protein